MLKFLLATSRSINKLTVYFVYFILGIIFTQLLALVLVNVVGSTMIIIGPILIISLVISPFALYGLLYDPEKL